MSFIVTIEADTMRSPTPRLMSAPGTSLVALGVPPEVRQRDERARRARSSGCCAEEPIAGDLELVRVPRPGRNRKRLASGDRVCSQQVASGPMELRALALLSLQGAMLGMAALS